MRLWLDDLRPSPEGWIHAWSVEMAIELVEMAHSLGIPLEEMSLDHDLGDFSSRGGDGIKFVDWMAENNIWPHTKPVVHSMNPVGRERMMRTIDRYWSKE